LVPFSLVTFKKYKPFDLILDILTAIFEFIFHFCLLIFFGKELEDFKRSLTLLKITLQIEYKLYFKFINSYNIKFNDMFKKKKSQISIK
jgi:hypothetical protein